tara:strand:+ start:242 stop:667 length:426 start_codon:yes stop_codon:yes gene_type:complete
MIPQILGAIGGGYAAYSATPEGEDIDPLKVALGAGAGIMNPASGILGGFSAGAGDISKNQEENSGKENEPTNTTALGTIPNSVNNTTKVAQPNDITADVPLNPSYGKPTVSPDAQNRWKTMTGQEGQTTDDQAKSMLGIAT